MRYDIIIVGGGMVGQTLACALAQQTSLSIAMLEIEPHIHAWSSSTYHHRVSAISLSSQRIFQALDVWDDIRKKRISPFNQIHVWDGKEKGEICFDSSDIGETVLGHILENNVIQLALEETIKKYPQIEVISSVKPAFFSETETSVEIITNDERHYSASLAIASDGAHSWLRAQAGIEVDKHDYQQEAIVVTAHTALPHQKIARQVFLETGPLAFLPLANQNMSSIVWSLPKEVAGRFMQMDSSQFKIELAQAFSHRLGDILEIEKRYIFPLSAQRAKKYIKSRVVLVGDAAHTVHPLAGQDVNMGLLDAACLAEVMIDAYKHRHDMASISHLRRYERWRAADNFAMQKAIHTVQSLFASEKKSIQRLRSFGLQMTNQVRWVKNIFSRYAAGNRDGLPALAKAIKT